MLLNSIDYKFYKFDIHSMLFLNILSNIKSTYLKDECRSTHNICIY